MDEQLAQQIELLHAYHLELWSEVEAQLRVIRSAQDQIGALRKARHDGDPEEQVRQAAEMLATHVQTLKGRSQTLSATITELDGTVKELLRVLSTR